LRLRSRNPIWIEDPGPTNTVYDLLARWREMWSLSAPVHSDLVRNPTVEPPMHRWGYSNATNCDCGHPRQTMNHVIDDFPIHAFEDGLVSLYEATPEAIQYLSDLNIDL
jgi:hypothetical protein